MYVNPPLEDTVFEIRFPGEPAIECERGRFFDRIRESYPRVYVPKAKDGVATALEPYRFESEDESKGLMLSIIKFSLYEKRYADFGTFRDEVLEVSSVFSEVFQIEQLKRTGLRYINAIPFMREKSAIPMHKYLNVAVDLPSLIPTDLENFNIVLVSPTEGGSITTRITPAISEDMSQEAIILDFDYAKEGDLMLSCLDKYLDESHEHTKRFFEELISEDYKKIMRGEVIE